MDLNTQKKCTPCTAKTPPLEGEQLQQFLQALENRWTCSNEHHLEKEFPFKNFKEALSFVNQVGALAEKEGHHPDIHLAWGKVRIVLWTHKINGLSENDFLLAAKIEEIAAP